MNLFLLWNIYVKTCQPVWIWTVVFRQVPAPFNLATFLWHQSDTEIKCFILWKYTLQSTIEAAVMFL